MCVSTNLQLKPLSNYRSNPTPIITIAKFVLISYSLKISYSLILMWNLYTFLVLHCFRLFMKISTKTYAYFIAVVFILLVKLKLCLKHCFFKKRGIFHSMYSMKYSLMVCHIYEIKTFLFYNITFDLLKEKLIAFDFIFYSLFQTGGGKDIRRSIYFSD